MPPFPHPEIPVLTFISAAAVLLPLPYHWRTGNVPVVALIFWLFVCCFTYGISSVIWAGTARIFVPVWCDIGELFFLRIRHLAHRFVISLFAFISPVTKLQIGANLGIPTSCLCISIQLAHISAFKRRGQSKSEKKWERITRFVLCWCLPLVYMAVRRCTVYIFSKRC
jgi:pheromone a factor receptor